MMDLLNDVVIRCEECGEKITIYKEDIDFETYVYDHGENGMGDEVVFTYKGDIVCECGNVIPLRISGYEYPVGVYDYEDSEIEGGDFIVEPHMGIIYFRDEFDVNFDSPTYTDVEQLIMRIDCDNNLIYDISPREFEKVVEQIFRDEGFETYLTSSTRDGGRDIVATKYEFEQPIVFYVECKKYGKENSVGVSVVRALWGVQTADRINKSILFTTGHVTRDAYKFINEQNTMMSVINAEKIFQLIQKSAQKYRDHSNR